MTESKPLTEETVYVAGHTGLVGSAMCRKLQKMGVDRIVTAARSQLDLTRQEAVESFFTAHRIDRVIVAAAKVGGIHANNTYPEEFIGDNLLIQTHLIRSARKAGVRHLLFLGSSCIYPKMAPQPMKEEHLMTGLLEPTNAPYAVAKIAGIFLCEASNRQYGTRYRAVMPTNLYGPGDNYHLQNSHVLPALIRKFHLARLAAAGDFGGIAADEARFGAIPETVRRDLGIGGNGEPEGAPTVRLWGTGSPRREFLHVDDMADASLFVMSLGEEAFENATRPHGLPFVNVGAGRDATIAELAELVAGVVGYDGKVIWDDRYADGAPRKLLDVSKLTELGWTAGTGLRRGIEATYRAYLDAL